MTDGLPSPSHAKPFYRGRGFTLSYASQGDEFGPVDAVVYAERHGRIKFLSQWTDRKPVVLVPRPELWDAGVPPFLRDRFEEVTQRLQDHSNHDVEYGPDQLYVKPVPEPFDDSTEATRKPCECCDADIVAPKGPDAGRPGELVLDIDSTDEAIRARVADGRFEVIRASNPIDELVDAVIERGVYSAVAFLRCTISDETIFWGLSSYGSPAYKHVRSTGPYTWPWGDGQPVVDNAPRCR